MSVKKEKSTGVRLWGNRLNALVLLFAPLAAAFLLVLNLRRQARLRFETLFPHQLFLIEQKYKWTVDPTFWALSLAALAVLFFVLAYVLGRKEVTAWRRIPAGSPALLFALAPCWIATLLPINLPLGYFTAAPAAMLALVLLLSREWLRRTRVAGPLAAALFLFTLALVVLAGGQFTHASVRIGFIASFVLVFSGATLLLARGLGGSVISALVWLMPAFSIGLVGVGCWLVDARFGLSASLLLAAPATVGLLLFPHRKTTPAFSALMVLLILLSAGAAETAARFSLFDTRWRPMNMGTDFIQHEDLFFVSCDMFVNKPDKEHGWLLFHNRQARLQADPDTFRVVVMGGSNAYGYHLASSAKSFSQLLEEKLNAAGAPKRFEVLNAAVPGFILFQVMILFEREVLAYRPDLLLLYLNVNDSSCEGGPYTLRQLWLMDNRHLGTELADYLSADEGWPTAAGWVSAAHRFFYRFRLYNGLTKTIVRLRERSLPPSVKPGRWLGMVNPPRDYRRNLLRVIDVCRRNGIQPVLVDAFALLAPQSDCGKEAEIRAIMREEAERDGVPYLGIHDEFNRRADKDDLVIQVDPYHLGAFGHSQVAERLAQFLIENELVPIGGAQQAF